MKYTDDYKAKFKIWAKEKKIMPLPRVEFPFKIESRKFHSYQELNEWKHKLLIRIANAGGVKWMK